MESFYEVARQVHATRVREQRYEDRTRQYCGENVFTRFKMWCQVKGKDMKNAYDFANFLSEEKIQLTPFQRRAIAIRHFGYKAEFNSEKNKWEMRK